MGMRANELAQLLKAKAEELCELLLPSGKKNRGEWVVGDIEGNEGHSMGVCITGEKAGQWNDLADIGKSGDLIGLIMAVKKCTVLDACIFACKFLGIDHNSERNAIERNKLVKNYYRPTPTGEEIPEKVLKYLTQERKISEQTLKAYKIYGKGDWICFPKYIDDICCGISSISIVRKEDGSKSVMQANDTNEDKSKRLPTDPCLFGCQILDGTERELILTEGQIDAMSYYEYGYKAVSIPSGINNMGWIERNFDMLSMFDTIFISVDMDEAGQKALPEIIKRLGAERCRIIKLPKKDINECLQSGIPKEEITALINNAAYCDPIELKWANEFYREILEKYYPSEGAFLGIKPPFQKALGKIQFRPSELSIWRGFSGHGKSQFLGQILLSTLQQGRRFCVASMELKPRDFLYKLTIQVSAGETHPSELYVRQMAAWLGENLCIFECTGTARADRLLAVFEYVHKRYGVDQFLIDSFMKLDIAEDDYKGQKQFLDKICDFKNKFNSHVHLIVHSRKRMSEAEAPNKMDVKGSGSIIDLSDNSFVIWRNKIKEAAIDKQNNGVLLSEKETEELRKSDTFWGCDKQRNGDWEGMLGFWFNKQSFQFLEYESELPKKYLVEDKNKEWFED